MSVYVFGEPGSLIVKVGYSRWGSIERRAQNLRVTTGVRGCMLSVHKHTRNIASGYVERWAHRLLKPRFHFQGEWFVCGLATAKSAIRHAIKLERRKARA